MFRIHAKSALLALGLASLPLAASQLAHAQTSQNPFFNTLHTFNNQYGSAPEGAMVQGADGFLYGTTRSGGFLTNSNQYGYGTIYRIDLLTHMFTTLHKFGGKEGEAPNSALTQGADGNLYGTTTQDTTSKHGVVFKMTPDGTFTTLHIFGTNASDGSYPSGALIRGLDGNFYGFTAARGSLYQVTSEGTLTTLYTFTATGANGLYPQGNPVQGADGTFYGVTFTGDTAHQYGTVFSLSADGRKHRILHVFNSHYGINPGAGLTFGPDGALYGTTNAGGNTEQNYPNGCGTIFRITTDAQFTTLYKFQNKSDGAFSRSALVVGRDGNFYGTTSGNNDSVGTVFRVTPTGQFTTLYSFSGNVNSVRGYFPSSLAFAVDGHLYGTTQDGGMTNGVRGYGTIFKLTLP